MKIENHYKPTAYYLDDGTHMKGTITMNYQEWCEAYQHLKNQYVIAKKNTETYKRDSLSYALKQFDRKKPFSVGVTGTFEIVTRFNLLDKYKNQNYAIYIN